MAQATTSFNWWASLVSGSAGGYALLALATLIALVWVLCGYARLHRRAYSHAQRPERDGQGGVATIEFALVFPIILFLMLLLIQVTLVMVGNMFVHYSAFAATRSAVVQIPADDSDPAEPANVIVPSEGYPKFDRIEQAAMFAVVPVCGRVSRSRIDAGQLPAALHRLFQAQGRDAPNWVDSLTEDRLNYAARKTSVKLLRTSVNDGQVRFDDVTGGRGQEFGPRDPITVKVDHKLNLSVPYVRGIFSDGRQDLIGGEGAYTDLSAQYTLTNEGIDPTLPPLPDLPRNPSAG